MSRGRPASVRPPAERIALAENLRRHYGGALTLRDLMDALGYRDPEAAKRWVKENNLDAVVLNGGRKKYLAIDVARILDNSKIMGAAV